MTQQTTQKLFSINILISSLEMKVSVADQSDLEIVNENDQICKLLQQDQFNSRNKAVKDLKMSTIVKDPVDRLLDAAQSGKTLIKNRDVLHFTHMPELILHSDPEQEKLTQSL